LIASQKLIVNNIYLYGTFGLVSVRTKLLSLSGKTNSVPQVR